MTPRLLILPLAVLLAAPVLSGLWGCGSSNSASQQTLPPKQFAKQADLICTNAANEQPKLAATYVRRHPGATESDLVEPAVIPPLEKMVKKLKTLALPTGQEARAEAFFAAVEKALQAVKENPEDAVSEQRNPFGHANHLGAKLKLGDCSRNP